MNGTMPIVVLVVVGLAMISCRPLVSAPEKQSELGDRVLTATSNSSSDRASNGMTAPDYQGLWWTNNVVGKMWIVDNMVVRPAFSNQLEFLVGSVASVLSSDSLLVETETKGTCVLRGCDITERADGDVVSAIVVRSRVVAYTNFLGRVAHSHSYLIPHTISLPVFRYLVEAKVVFETDTPVHGNELVAFEEFRKQCYAPKRHTIRRLGKHGLEEFDSPAFSPRPGVESISQGYQRGPKEAVATR